MESETTRIDRKVKSFRKKLLQLVARVRGISISYMSIKYKNLSKVMRKKNYDKIDQAYRFLQNRLISLFDLHISHRRWAY